MHVLKFGGTSMGDEHAWREILGIIEDYNHPVVIVSATARTTRRLIAAAELAVTDYKQATSIAREIKERHQVLVKNFMANYEEEITSSVAQKCESRIEKCITKLHQYLDNIAAEGELTLQVKDAVASIGEQLSSRLFVDCGTVFGLNMVWVDAGDIIKTDADYGNAKPDFELIKESAKHISVQLDKGNIPVMGGYYGKDSSGYITTLGFEGSDFSASLIGSVLGAEAIEIWTDVSGIYTCDPRIVESASPIKELSFREATEMAYFGAKVLHPATMNPAEEKQIPIFVKNIFEPDHPGTKIQGKAPTGGLAKAMTFMRDVVIITVTSPHSKMGYEFLADVFNVLRKYRLAVNVVTTTEAAVSVALKEEKVSRDVLQSLQKIGKVNKIVGLGIISLIGCNFEQAGRVRNVVLSALPDQQISMLSYSRSKENVNIVLPAEDLISSVNVIHEKLFEQ